MNGFTTKTPNQKALDPTKRVKYSLGMVLGPDEFEQNLTYLMERDRLHNRSLHGYGTVCGLKVMQLMDDDDHTATAFPPQVLVQPGIAVNPQGQFIRVCQPQCGDLNKWLENNEDEVNDYLGSPVEPDRLTLYVVLCFAECDADSTFVPGGPCRTQEETIVPSRIADSFELKLIFEAPAHVEEAVVSRLGDLLCRIEISVDADTYTSQDELELLVRGLSEEAAETDFVSPEEPPAPFYLHPADAAEILEHIFRVWVTEVRPQLLACGQNCAAGPPDQECVLLAEIAFDLNTAHDGSLLVGSPVSVNETERPILLHTRLLQEKLLCGETSHHADHLTFATLSRTGAAAIRAWIHYHELLDVPVESLTVTGSEIEVLDVNRLGTTNVFDIELATSPPLNLVDEPITVAFDAAQITVSAVPEYTLLENMHELDLNFIDCQDNLLLAYLVVDRYALNELMDVEALPASNGDVLTWDEVSERWSAAPLSNTPPEDGQVLTWDDVGGEWTAAEPPAGGGPAPGPSDHGALGGLTHDDHKQYLLVNQTTRALVANLNAANKKVVSLSHGAAPGEALVFGQNAIGDLSGSYPSPRVKGLQGRPVSNMAPSPGEVLTWSTENVATGQWEPDTNARVSTFAEPELTRIVALSWVHGRFSTLLIQYDNKAFPFDPRRHDPTKPQDFDPDSEVMGLIITFGKTENVIGSGLVVAETINQYTFQVFVENQIGSSLMAPARIVPEQGMIVPVSVLVDGGGNIVGAKRVSGPLTPGALFIIGKEALANLEIPTLYVVVKGDFILDETREKAIDAEHVRAILPTGDRPHGFDLGIQGGRFESWLHLRKDIERPVDINHADERELARLPGIGLTTARLIVANRPFNSYDELTTVDRISPGLVNNIRGLITIG